MRTTPAVLLQATFLPLLTACIAAAEPTSVTLPPTSAPPPTLAPTAQPTETPTSPPTPTPLALVEAAFEDQGRVLYLDSGAVRLGVDTQWGGAIREIWLDGENLINNYDGGRLLAVSFYDSDRLPASNHPNDTGWNPTPSDMYNHANPLLEYSFSENELYTRARYLQWFPNDKGGGPGLAVPTDVYVETWIAFFGTPDTVRIRYRLSNEGPESHGLANQEFPFAYIRTPFHRFVSYAGLDPWAGRTELIREIPLQGNSGGLTAATERWAGFVNQDNQGLLLWAPQSYGEFSYSFFDNPGPEENRTFYLLPRGFLAIPPGYSQETQVFLLLGDWLRSRERIYQMNGVLEFPDIMPSFGTVDAPAAGAAVSGTLVVDGWAVDNHGVAEVEILIDGHAIGTARYGNPRPDVDRDYPGLPDAPRFGFHFETAAARLPGGAHALEVVVTDLSGNRSQLRPGAITIDIDN